MSHPKGLYRMAKRYLPLVVASLVAAVVGCQPAGPMVNVPPPKFTGPTIRPPAPAPAPARTYAAQPAPAGGPWAPKVKAHGWKYIVIHHSATPAGSLASFDREHKSKGWDEIGYHFVVGNGTLTGDGQVEPTRRWAVQKWGAHTKTADNRFNDYGIGICLVGNFDDTRPSSKQMQSVAKLVSHLMKTYKVPPSQVYGHGQCKPTNCPGQYMSVARVKQMATQMLADSGVTVAESDDLAQVTPSTELLQDGR